MAQASDGQARPTARETFETSCSGAQARPFIPRLRSDPPPYHPLPKSLVEFREREGREERKKLLRQLWQQLPKPEYYVPNPEKVLSSTDRSSLNPEEAEELRHMYVEELLGTCGRHVSGNTVGPVDWKAFREYAEAKEAGTVIRFHEDVHAG